MKDFYELMKIDPAPMKGENLYNVLYGTTFKFDRSKVPAEIDALTAKVKEEYAAIRDAMKMRGITTLRSPMKMLEYRVVPLMISIAKIGEELSAAALTRGLGAPAKTDKYLHNQNSVRWMYFSSC